MLGSKGFFTDKKLAFACYTGTDFDDLYPRQTMGGYRGRAIVSRTAMYKGSNLQAEPLQLSPIACAYFW
jgi:hypothetical protein